MLARHNQNLLALADALTSSTLNYPTSYISSYDLRTTLGFFFTLTDLPLQRMPFYGYGVSFTETF